MYNIFNYKIKQQLKHDKNTIHVVNPQVHQYSTDEDWQRETYSHEVLTCFYCNSFILFLLKMD